MLLPDGASLPVVHLCRYCFSAGRRSVVCRVGLWLGRECPGLKPYFGPGWDSGLKPTSPPVVLFCRIVVFCRLVLIRQTPERCLPSWAVAGKRVPRAKALFWAGVGQWAKAHFSAGSAFLAEYFSARSASLSVLLLCRTTERCLPSWAVAGKKVPRAKAPFLGGGRTVG